MVMGAYMAMRSPTETSGAGLGAPAYINVLTFGPGALVVALSATAQQTFYGRQA
jgi:hypothetical protein